MLKDVQGQEDIRQISLKQVGINNLNWPLVVKDKQCGQQHTVAQIAMSVNLPHTQRGTHMSRFVECLNDLEAVEPTSLEKLLDNLKVRLEAKKAVLKMSFSYFVNKQAPVSGVVAPLEIKCKYDAEKQENFELITTVEVPIHTLCPCSKEISVNGAHNQRAIAKMEIKSTHMVWFEELVAMAEESASTPIYTILKRPDEKFVTEQAYANPRFVEDAVREIALRLEQDERITWYCVTVESMESIHNHNAFAVVEKTVTE